MEKLCCPREIAKMFGLSDAYIRAACFRGKEHHPLPCVDVGEKSRRCFRIRPSVFERWLEEEEQR